MQDIIFISLVVIFLTVSYFYASNMYFRQLRNWNHEITWRKVFIYITPIAIKSLVALFLIILIHNSFYDEHLFQLTLFIFVFFIFSIFQSSFSIMGFFNRNKYVYASFLEFFRGTSNRINGMFQRLGETINGVTFLLRVGIIIGFIAIFIPNISLVVTSNLIFLLLIVLMIGLALLQNNIIYFGLTSLFVFQLNEATITLDNIPYLILFVSFIILAVGVTLETRLERRMFVLINVLPVKRLNFNLGYDIVWDRRSIIIYQNQVNQYYYTYFRKIGIVVVYHSLYDAKISYIVLNRMIRYGKSYLKNNNIE